MEIREGGATPAKMYMNRYTGELLTRREMAAQFQDEYDGDDPTNLLGMDAIYVGRDVSEEAAG